MKNRIFKLFYADKDFTVNGSGSGGGKTYTYTNVTLKRGWNYMSEATSGATVTYTASQEKPAGATWTVKNN